MNLIGIALLYGSVAVMIHTIATHTATIRQLEAQVSKDTTAIDDILVAMLKED